MTTTIGVLGLGHSPAAILAAAAPDVEANLRRSGKDEPGFFVRRLGARPRESLAAVIGLTR